MLVKTPHILLSATLALSAAATGFAHSSYSSHPRRNDDRRLERRGYDILDAYQHSSRGFFDPSEDAYETRSDRVYQREREDAIEELAARFAAVKTARDGARDGHQRSTVLSRRDFEDEGRQAGSIFIHDDKAFKDLKSRIQRRKSAAKHTKALEQRALAKRQAELERREEEDRRASLARRSLENLILEARAFMDENDDLEQREYEIEIDVRDFEDDFIEARDGDFEHESFYGRDFEGEEELEARTEEVELDARMLQNIIHMARRSLADDDEHFSRDEPADGLDLEARDDMEDFYYRDFGDDEYTAREEAEFDARAIEELLEEARALADEEELAARGPSDEVELDARDVDIDSILLQVRERLESAALSTREEETIEARDTLSDDELAVRAYSEDPDLQARVLEAILLNQPRSADAEAATAVEAREPSLSPANEESVDARAPLVEDSDSPSKRETTEETVNAREPSAEIPETHAKREVIEEAVDARETPTDTPGTLSKREIAADDVEARASMAAAEPAPLQARTQEETQVEAREPVVVAEASAPVEARDPEAPIVQVEARNPDNVGSEAIFERSPTP